jgi:hypothetical protein
MYTPPSHRAGSAPHGLITGHLPLVSFLLAGILVLGGAGVCRTGAQGLAARAADQGDIARQSQRLTIHSTLPLAFEPNRGQAPPHTDFLAHGHGYALALSARGMAITLGGRPLSHSPAFPAGGGRSAPVRAPDHTTMQLALLGGDPAARAEGISRLPGTVGYAPGPARAAWRSGIPTYATVRYTGVYRGVDMDFQSTQGRLEYDFELAPGADPRQIQLAAQGATSVSLDAQGGVVVHTPLGDVRQSRPVAYQLIGGARRAVDAAYTLGGSTIGFRLGTYDPRAALVIDPVVVVSLYYGGAGDDRGNGIAVDSQGAMYVVGTTTSAYAAQAAFVTKFSSDGTQALWTQFFSNDDPSNASNKTCDSQGAGIAVDSQGNIDVTGTYGYDDEFNLCNNQAVLWARFDPSGTILADKIYGQYGGNYGTAIAVDTQGNSYITGQTDNRAPAFPVTPGAFQTTAGIDTLPDGGVAGDAFVLKLDTSGAIVYGTFLGGAGIDEGYGIAVDAQGDAVVGGSTGATVYQQSNFPVTDNAFQRQPGNYFAPAFVSELNPSGSALLYSTFLSGNSGEIVSAVGFDAQGNIYATGNTESANFPVTASAYKRFCGDDGLCNPVNSCYWDWGTAQELCHIYNAEDVFLTKFNPALSGAASLVYSTYLGGANRDMGYGLKVDARGVAYITGRTASSDFPTLSASQPSLGGDWDAFVATIDTTRSGTASLLSSTFLGGSAYDEGDDIAIDGNGNLYVTGYTISKDFPTMGPQSSNAGGADAFIAKLSAQAPIVPSALTLNPATVTGGQPTSGTITLSAPAPAGGATITLSSSSNVAAVPASVLIAAGATSAGFTVSTLAVTSPSAATISGTYNGASQSATLTVTAAVTATATTTQTPTATSTPPASRTSTTTATSTQTPTGTVSATATATATTTATATMTASASPSATGTPTNQVASIAAQAGWNLVSLPLTAGSLSASTMLSGLLQRSGGGLAAIYALSNGQWSSPLILRGGHAPSGTDFALQPGVGYLLYSDASGSYLQTGAVPAAQPIWTLRSGWNMVGIAVGGSGPIAASTVLQGVLASGNGSVAAIYALSNGQWSSPLILRSGHAPGGTDFALQPGMGYLLYTDRSASYTPGAAATSQNPPGTAGAGAVSGSWQQPALPPRP